MGHYDGQCKHCKDYGYFFDVACPCEGAVAARKKEEEVQRRKDQQEVDFLANYGIDTYDVGHGPEVDAEDLVKALKKLIKEGRLT